MYDIYVNVGRWQTVKDYLSVPDINDRTLRDVARKHWEAMPTASQQATQVLIWSNDGPPQNLIAVYTPALDKLVFME
jgi:hypothetical protein